MLINKNPFLSIMQFPYLTKQQITKLDHLMVNHFKISIEMMMENAGYRLAEFIRNEFPHKKKILLCIGKGNNGGDGLAAARHLLNFGYIPQLFLITKEINKSEPRAHLQIAKTLKIPIFTSLTKLKKEAQTTGLIYDCLIGYNLNGPPRNKFKQAIEIINQSKKPTIACDVPSGISDQTFEPHIQATHILFLSLPKKGLKNYQAKKFFADIGVPADLYPMIGVKKENYFEKGSILEID